MKPSSSDPMWPLDLLNVFDYSVPPSPQQLVPTKHPVLTINPNITSLAAWHPSTEFTTSMAMEDQPQKITNSAQLQISSESVISVTKNSNLWHHRLGHISTSDLKQLAKIQVVAGFSLKHVPQQVCSTYLYGKLRTTKFHKIATTCATQLLEVVHSDLKEAHGIKHQLTTTYTLHQNSFAERKNRTLLNTTPCLLHESMLSKPYWGEAVTCATYLQNCCPTKAIPPDTTPFELWHKRQPDIAHLRVFGSHCFAKIPDPLRVKLDNKTHECIFLGYSPFSKGYKVQQISNGAMITSRDVVFKEELGSEYYSVLPASRASDFELQKDPCFYQPTGSSTLHSFGTSSGLKKQYYGQACDLAATYGSTSTRVRCWRPSHQYLRAAALSLLLLRPGHLSVDAAPVPLRQSFRTTRGVPPPRDPDENYNPKILKPRSEKSRRPPHALISAKEVPLEPATYVQAINSPEASQWKIAIAEELNSHAVNSTTFTHLPPHRKAITCRWIFKIKLKNSGAVDRFKAHLVARGFNQIQGLDYHETFSPVVRIQSIRLILALAVQLDLHVHQMDVKTAFLNGSLQEEIYMKIPEGVTPPQPGMVINTYLATLGFLNSTADGNVYYLHRGSDFAILTLYVDDTLTSSSLLLLHNIKQQLHSRFLLSDLGEVHHILSLETTRNRQHGWIRVSQQLYLTQKLLEFGFLDSWNPGVQSRLPIHRGRPPLQFRIPDCQCLFSPNSCIIRVLHISARANIRSVISAGPWHTTLSIADLFRSPLHYGFSDADWTGELDERRSTSGYCFLLSEGVISWSSTRQRSTALFSTEAEYIAMATAASGLVWIRHLLHDLHHTETLNYPTEIHCDNQSALALVDTTKFHSRTKHIAIPYNFFRQLSNHQKLKFRYCSTHHMRANLFTKSLSGPKLAQHLPLLGILGGETPATS
uniref:Reverse transcriptase Ty1/copia-type domain-containing protein n=1 Tax=Physcomitrium patens TaxID=3218 RepID=A0A2K1IZT3_PHYPA|nr:hypothetical protein PHYPA_022685 [Physcomitrium patens]